MALPSDLLDEILYRLPVKHLLRCRCVSKGWCSLIDSTGFAKKHLKRTLECDVGGLIINGRGKFYLAEDIKPNLDGDDSDEVVAVEINDPLKTLISGADFVGSANGLVCVSKNLMNVFIVFNSSTRKSRKIPSAPAEFPRSFHMTETSLCGFGYDSVNDDYKIVKIAECYLQFLGKMVIVYSLKTNSWKQILNVPAHNTRFFGDWGMFALGALHWLAIDYPINVSDIIVGFDLGLEQFKELPSPVHEGPIGNFNTRSVRPVYISMSDQSILFEVDSSELVWYDLERKMVKNVKICGPMDKFDSHVYTQSLIQLNKDSPPLKPSQEKPHKEHQKKSDDFLSKGFKLRL